MDASGRWIVLLEKYEHKKRKIKRLHRVILIETLIILFLILKLAL